MSKTGEQILNEISVLKNDEHMRDIMRELEFCDELLYNENLSPCMYIEVLSRKNTLIEMRDSYSNWLNKKQ